MLFACTSCGRVFPLNDSYRGELKRNCPECGIRHRVVVLNHEENFVTITEGCALYRKEGTSPEKDDLALSRLLREHYQLGNVKPADDDFKEDIDWEEVEVLTGPRYEITDELSDPFITSQASEWKVISQNGYKTYTFHYLSVLKRWIVEGMIVPEDTIELPDGSKVLVKNYKPVSDLFDSQRAAEFKLKYKKKLEAAKISGRVARLVEVKKRREKRRRKAAFFIFIVTACILFALGAFEYRSRLIIKRGEEILKSAVSSVVVKKRVNLKKVVEKTKKAVLSGDVKSIVPAEEELLSALASGGKDVELESMLALLWAVRAEKEGDISLAERSLGLSKMLSMLRKKAPFVWAAKAYSEFSVGNKDSAARDLRRAVSLTGDDVFLLRLEAVLAGKLNDMPQKLILLSKANEIVPNDPNVAMELAETMEKLGKKKSALAVLESTLAYNPKNTILLKTVADLRLALGDKSGAADIYRKILEYAPKTEKPYAELAKIEMENKNYEEVIKIAEAYDKNFPLGGSEAARIRKIVEIVEKKLERKRLIEERRNKRRVLPSRRWGVKRR